MGRLQRKKNQANVGKAKKKKNKINNQNVLAVDKLKTSNNLERKFPAVDNGVRENSINNDVIGKKLQKVDKNKKDKIKDNFEKNKRKKILISSKKDGNLFNRTINYFRESKVELKKVVWPSRKQVLGSTCIVVLVVGLFSIFFGAVDVALSTIIQSILR